MAAVEFLPTVQALVQAYQAFESHSGAHIRSLGLTPPQFDIVATLGNTAGMTATDHQNRLGVGVGHHRNMDKHLVVGELIELSELDDSIQHQQKRRFS